MNLGNLLSVDRIVPEMQASERWSAIVELVELLVVRGKVKPDDRDLVLAALRQREETMSTGIGFGIAIPHASSDRVGEVVAAFGRSLTASSVVFVSQAAAKAGLGKKLGIQKELVAVQHTRDISKKSMIHNGATPKIEVDPETYEVRADGELLTCAPAEVLPMAQRYFMF